MYKWPGLAKTCNDILIQFYYVYYDGFDVIGFPLMLLPNNFA